MATNWWDTYVSGSVATYTNINDWVDAMQHNSAQEARWQTFNTDNLYLGSYTDTDTKTLWLRTDSISNDALTIRLQDDNNGGQGLYLDTYESEMSIGTIDDGTQYERITLNKDSADITIKNQAGNQAFIFTWDSDSSDIKGANTAGHDLILQPNTQDSWGYLKMRTDDHTEWQFTNNTGLELYAQGTLTHYIYSDRSVSRSYIYGMDSSFYVGQNNKGYIFFPNSDNIQLVAEGSTGTGIIDCITDGRAFYMRSGSYYYFQGTMSNNGANAYWYGGQATEDNLYIYPNTADTHPFFRLRGDGDAELQVPSGQSFKIYNSGSQMFNFFRNSHISRLRGSDALIIYANESYPRPQIYMYESGSIMLDAAKPGNIVHKINDTTIFTFSGNATRSKLFGGDAATDDLWIWANNASDGTYPRIRLEGGSHVYLDVPSDKSIYITEEETEFFTFNFDDSDNTSYIRGNADSTGTLAIYATNAGRPWQLIHTDTGNFEFDTKAGGEFIFKEGDTPVLTIASGTTIYMKGKAKATYEPTKTLGTIWMSSNAAGTDNRLYLISGDSSPSWMKLLVTGEGGTGVSNLSDLTIDTNKGWKSYGITGLSYMSSQTISGQLLKLHKARDIDDGVGGGWDSKRFDNSGLIWDHADQRWEPMPSGGSGGGSASAEGDDTNVQFNEGGSFGGDAEFTWNTDEKVLTIQGNISSQSISSSGYFGGLHYPADYVFYRTVQGITPRTYYAKYCRDGTIQSDTNCARLLNSICKSNTKIFVASGEYILTDTVYPKGGSMIQGAGVNATRFNMSDRMKDIFHYSGVSHCTLRDVEINKNWAAHPNSGAMIKITATPNTNPDADVGGVRSNTFENIFTDGGGTYTSGTAIHLYASGSNTAQSVSLCRFNNIYAKRGWRGIWLQNRTENDAAGAYMNSNYFTNIFIITHRIGIEFDSRKSNGDIPGDFGGCGKIGHHRFKNLDIQGNSTRGHIGVKEVTGMCNSFDSCIVWDFNTWKNSSNGYTWSIHPSAQNTYVNIQNVIPTDGTDHKAGCAWDSGQRTWGFWGYGSTGKNRLLTSKILASEYISSATGIYAHFISANNSNLTGAGGGIDNVVEDTTPQLGGDLDGQDTYGINDITYLSSQTISGGSIIGRPVSHFLIRKEGENFVGYNPIGEEIVSNSDFATACQTVANNTKYSGSSYIFIENCNEWIPITSTIKFSANSITQKDFIIDGDMNSFKFGTIGEDTEAFRFDGWSGRQMSATLKNFTISGDKYSEGQAFVMFHNIRSYVDNITTNNNRSVNTAIKISGTDYLGEIKNCFIHGKYCIYTIGGYLSSPDDYAECNGLKIYNNNLGYGDNHDIDDSCAIRLKGGVGVQILNNWFEKSTYMISGTDTDHIRIIGNHFGVANSCSGHIYLPDGFFQEITDNWFSLRSNGMNGIYWDEGWVAGSISNNTINVASNRENITFLRMNTVTEYEVTDNIMHVGSNNEGTSFIKSDGNCIRGLIANNRIDADSITGDQAAIEIQNATNTIVEGNAIRNYNVDIDIGTSDTNLVVNNLGTLNTYNYISSQAISGGTIKAFTFSGVQHGGLYAHFVSANKSNIAGAGATPGGSDTQVQYNNAGSFAGDSDFTWDNSTDTLTVDGNISLGGRLSHEGDAGTEMEFEVDKIRFHAGTTHDNFLFIDGVNDKTYINEEGGDIDFIVSGDTAPLFYGDAGNSQVGILTNSPEHALHVNGGIYGNGISSQTISGGITKTAIIESDYLKVRKGDDIIFHISGDTVSTVDTFLFGGTNANGDLIIRPNTVVEHPEILLDGEGDVIIKSVYNFQFQKESEDVLYIGKSDDETQIIGQPDNFKLATNSTWPYISLSSNGRIKLSGATFASSISSQTISGGTIKGSSAYRGWGNVSDGGTIAHGCPRKPSYVNLSPSGTNPIMYSFKVDATNITVYHSDAGSRDFSWRCEI